MLISITRFFYQFALHDSMIDHDLFSFAANFKSLPQRACFCKILWMCMEADLGCYFHYPFRQPLSKELVRPSLVVVSVHNRTQNMDHQKKALKSICIPCNFITCIYKLFLNAKGSDLHVPTYISNVLNIDIIHYYTLKY